MPKRGCEEASASGFIVSYWFDSFSFAMANENSLCSLSVKLARKINALCPGAIVVNFRGNWHACFVKNKNGKMNQRDFYSELGKLLYATSDIDGVITKEEKERILDIVKKELLPAEKKKDRFGTNDAFYTEIEFEFLDEQIADPIAAFESFVNFVEDHKTAFTQSQIKACIRATKEVARAYRGTNKKEEHLIHELTKSLTAIQKGRSYSSKFTVKEQPDI
jgi:hypothetical protein